MEQPRRPHSHHLSLTTDLPNLKDTTKGLLHTIFFHRYFTPLAPATHEILDCTLPYIPAEEISSLIDARATALARQLEQSGAGGGVVVVQFLERKRRKGWFVSKAEEETVWENWVVEVGVIPAGGGSSRAVVEGSLRKAAMRVVGIVGRERAHIPPITSSESNPFPFHVLVNPRGAVY